MSAPVRDTALLADAHGLCVLPTRQDGTKRPDVPSWTPYQRQRPEPALLDAWYANGRTGVGAVTGAISGNLEAFEFDSRETYERFLDAARGVGLGALVERIRAGYEEESPKPGIHWLYRCATIAGNTELACRPVASDALGRPKTEPLIETRGEGGYIVLAPSHGAVHPSGRPYRLVRGGIPTIATIGPDERCALFDLAQTFDERPPQEAAPATEARRAPDGDRPGDDFAGRATWDAILLPHGWVRVYSRGGKGLWRRPGKDHGWSASTDHAESGYFYCFSSSTAFEPRRGYGKFSVYALLEHGGDFRAAARALAGKGYGAPRSTVRKAGTARGAEEARPNLDPGLTKELADAILAEHHFAQDAGDKLCHYAGGVYRPRGDQLVARRVKQLLEAAGETKRWSPRRGEAVAEYIRLDAPLLWERPPLDRVNLQNGLLDLATRELRPHSPAFLSPVQLPVGYDAAAACPAWEDFIAATFPADARAVAYEIVADLLTPDRSCQKAILLQGEGSNGKSTYLAAVMACIGPQNRANLSLHNLESNRFAAARLLGKLANICPDLPSTHLTETSTFKAVTGGDPITGEYKHGAIFDFTPHCRLIFSANHPPRSGDASHAFFRRWLVLPFERTFAEEEAIPRAELDARLADPRELSGVLNRALDALPGLRRRGFTESGSMRAAWDEFRQSTDPLTVWLDQHTVAGMDAFVAKRDLLAAYNVACDAAGRPWVTSKAFGQTLKRLRPTIGEAQRTIEGALQWVWLGLHLREMAR